MCKNKDRIIPYVPWTWTSIGRFALKRKCVFRKYKINNLKNRPVQCINHDYKSESLYFRDNTQWVKLMSFNVHNFCSKIFEFEVEQFFLIQTIKQV
jgi:hypothetical protein